MLAASECLKRAEQMDRAAERCRDPVAKTDFLLTAKQWRDLAATAFRIEGKAPR